ncbi:hypothetical protein M430DRAFT_254354 [Amorphotheca resinae ATCC 22711]|uniref:Uncharacterized protein n=1 Tax=Amorphotheca resinae ATCC 22711 TaxID=857342 RepID=A0A2T3AXY1_AMORE|nr:hypothetical protein M430DRAFT_254354 [Amorphotheca resinae ATCC 22711]PSS14913.1 hypothetical protein M430DRAFT_254354 [Amorphotheca resinae ATCC 22711]
MSPTIPSYVKCWRWDGQIDTRLSRARVLASDTVSVIGSRVLWLRPSVLSKDGVFFVMTRVKERLRRVAKGGKMRRWEGGGRAVEAAEAAGAGFPETYDY